MNARVPNAARNAFRARVAAITEPNQFSAAQYRAVSKLLNGVRSQYRALWRAETFKRRAPTPSHRAAIRAAVRSKIKRRQDNVTGTVGISATQARKMAAIANVIDPGFRNIKAGKYVAGRRIRQRVAAIMEKSVPAHYQQMLRQELLSILNQTGPKRAKSGNNV
jgi:uncharacterized protein (DUF885 family)